VGFGVWRRGAHIPSLWDLKVCSFSFMLRRSHSATVCINGPCQRRSCLASRRQHKHTWSDEPVRQTHSENGLNERQLAGAVWAWTV
jgi:hypothetical protein